VLHYPGGNMTKKTTGKKTAQYESESEDEDKVVPATPTPKKKSHKNNSPNEIAGTGKKEAKINKTESQQPKKTAKQLDFGKSKSAPKPVNKGSKAKNDVGTETDDSVEEEAKSYIEGLYEPIDINFIEAQQDSESRQYIFEELDTIFWPTLPMGYKWFYDSSDRSKAPIVKKYPDSKERNVEITIFGPDDEQDDPKKQVNYVTAFDDLNVQCYANTRLQGSLYNESPRYPAQLEIEHFRPYDRGHGIDFADTIDQDPKSERSASHIRNFIPEPVIWNRNLRRTWVGRIRKSEGAYIQRVYYHDYSLYHSDPQSSVTSNGTLIPTGAYFSHINSDRDEILKSADISWSYEFHKLPKPKKSTVLKTLDLAWPIFSIIPTSTPAALVYASDVTCKKLDKIIEKYDALALERPPLGNAYKISKYNRYMFEQLYQAAETEYLDVTYKIDFAAWCVEASLDEEAKLYLERAKAHADVLSEFDTGFQLSKSHFNLFKEYRKKVPTVFTDEQEDYWKKLAPKAGK
jgi:hypothetical protein